MQLSNNGFPRRNQVDRWTPAERAIREATNAVEAAGCHPLLTDAVNLLAQARDKVADFVELPPQPVRVRYDGSYASVKEILRWGRSLDVAGHIRLAAPWADPPDVLRLMLVDGEGRAAGNVTCRPGDLLYATPTGEVVVETPT